jgi:hypothetical protein
MGSVIWAWWPKRVEPSVLSFVLPYEKETQVQRGPSLVSQAFPIARSSGVGVPVSIEEERGRSSRRATKSLWNAVSALQPPVTQLFNLGYNKKLVGRYMRDERQPLQCLG